MTAAAAPRLVRETFSTSRLAELTTERELVAQTGHAVEDWPLVAAKELADNGIDNAEEIGVAPVNGAAIALPQIESLRTGVWCRGLAAAQPYRIVLFGEKSSLREDLEPIAREVGGELLLPTGEISDTLIAGIAARAADGRPSVVLYFADFDPSGFQMPVSVGRKLPAMRDLLYPELRIELHRVALTLEQCVNFNLPSTPLKESERRADKWRARTGREQTEIDALAALHPGALQQIAWEAIAPFWDATLADRVRDAQVAWWRAANAKLFGHPDYASANADLETALDRVRKAAEAVDRAQQQLKEKLSDIKVPPAPNVVEPEIAAEAPPPLFATSDDFITATIKLRAEKALDEGDEP